LLLLLLLRLLGEQLVLVTLSLQRWWLINQPRHSLRGRVASVGLGLAQLAQQMWAQYKL